MRVTALGLAVLLRKLADAQEPIDS
jgi:hypothetical protein